MILTLKLEPLVSVVQVPDVEAPDQEEHAGLANDVMAKADLQPSRSSYRPFTVPVLDAVIEAW